MGIASEHYDHGLLDSSGSFAKFTAIRRASSFVSSLAADRRPNNSAAASTLPERQAIEQKMRWPLAALNQ
jgi:hypothetical protein